MLQKIFIAATHVEDDKIVQLQDTDGEVYDAEKFASKLDEEKEFFTAPTELTQSVEISWVEEGYFRTNPDEDEKNNLVHLPVF